MFIFAVNTGEMKNIKFAVIGAGHIGKRHAEMVKRNPNAELLAFCDVRPAEECGIESFNVPLYRTSDELFANHPDCDVVCVCSPNGFHAEHSMAVLNARKHLVVEKPMALTKAECEDIIYKSLQVNKQST
jgi:UDP-N-acetyl-2-amino-2-deoxyglucuronate dehydrogenase